MCAVHSSFCVCVDAAWGVAMCRIIVSFALEVDLVSLGPHCFLQVSSAGSIVVLIPGCCWACSAFSMFSQWVCRHMHHVLRVCMCFEARSTVHCFFSWQSNLVSVNGMLGTTTAVVGIAAVILCSSWLSDTASVLLVQGSGSYASLSANH